MRPTCILPDDIGAVADSGGRARGHALDPVKMSHKKMVTKDDRINNPNPPPSRPGCWISFCGNGVQTTSRQHVSSLSNFICMSSTARFHEASVPQNSQLNNRVTALLKTINSIRVHTTGFIFCLHIDVIIIRYLSSTYL